MREHLRERVDDVSRQQVIVGLLVLLVIGAPVAYAAAGLFTAGSTFKTDSGLSVQVQQDQSLGGNPFVDAQTFDGDGGTITAESTGDGYLEVHQWGSSSTNAEVRNVSLNNTAATIAPDSSAINTVTIEGSAGTVNWGEINATDTYIDFTVNDANGLVNITLHGVTDGYSYRASTDGMVANGSDLTDVAENGKVQFVVGDGSYRLSRFKDTAPQITNLDPDGGFIGGNSVTLGAYVEDDSFYDGNVSVTFRVNGTTVHQTNISSSQRVEYTLTIASQLSGEVPWSVTATDPLDNETTASSSFKITDTIKVRNVSSPSQSLPNATATAYTSSGEVSLTANDKGELNLDKLPTEEDIPIVISAPGYHDRTMIIPTILQASDAFLIPLNNTSTVKNRFTLNDPTGEFDSDSVVIIERPVAGTFNDKWKVVAGDEFGVEGFTATLTKGQRYRVRIVSADGDVAQMGKFTAESTEEVPLRPQSPAVSVGSGEVIGYNATVSNGDLKIQYLDPQNETGVIKVYAVSRFNESKYLLKPQTHYDADQLVISEPVGELTDSYVVVLEIQRNGESSVIRMPIGPDQVSLLPGGLSQVWLQISSVGILLMVGGVFSRLNVGIGALVTSLLGGVMWYTGMLSGLATWASVAVAIVFSVVFTMVTQR